MSDLLTLLAQQSDKQAFSKEVLFWLGAIVVAAVVLGFIALWLRKALTREVEPGPSLGFTLADLREMHEQGELSDEEFEAAKGKMLAKSRADLENHDDTPRSFSAKSLTATGGTLKFPDRIICPLCQTKGSVNRKQVLRNQGVSGTKLAVAFITGGLSLFIIGLSRYEHETEFTCTNCGSSWFM